MPGIWRSSPPNRPWDSPRDRPGKIFLPSFLDRIIPYMQEGEPILRALSEGAGHRAAICGSEGRWLEIELLEPAAECGVGTAAELATRDAIYLGIIECRYQDRVRMSVEHLLDRKSLDVVRSVWRESGAAEGMD